MIRANNPKKYQIYFLRLIILVAVAFSIYFINWFFRGEIIENKILFSLISLGVIYRLLRLYHQWIHLFFLRTQPDVKTNKTDLTVDVFTTFCPGEPYDMVEKTLLAIKKIEYPHGTYLCCEGDDERLKSFCERNDINFIPRYERIDAKAGNINNGLNFSNAELCVILDPDHIPKPNFIEVVLPYFEDEKVGFVQVPQIYYNQQESRIAKGAAEQTYEFYGPLMSSMDRFGTAQAIGANCTFRREALNSIGGHAPGLTEDMHTSMLLHAEGWKSRFIPEVVSEGLVPVSKSTYFDQQLKWSRGSFDLLFKVLPEIFKKLTIAQKLHYLSIPIYFLFGVFVLFDFAIPILSLFTSDYPLKCRMDELAFVILPLIALSIFIRQYAQKWFYFDHEKGFHYYAEVLRLNVWWINTLGLIYTILGKKVPYIPTKKDDVITNEFKLAIPNILLLILIIISIVYGLNNDFSESSLLMISFLTYLSINLIFGVFLGFQLISENFINLFSLVNIGRFRLKLISITSYSLLLGALVLTYLFNFYYKNKVNEMGDVLPPENRLNTIEVFNNIKNENIQIINLDSLNNYSLDSSKFQYFTCFTSNIDSIELKKYLDRAFQIGQMPFFVDFINTDSISSNQVKSLFKYQYQYSLLNGKKPIFVFYINNVDSLQEYYPDAKYVDYINLNVLNKKVNESLLISYHSLMLKHQPIIISNVSEVVNYGDLKLCFKNVNGLFFNKYINKTFENVKYKKVNQYHSPIKEEKIEYTSELKGIYYNTKQDWKDNFQSLTNKDINRDFDLIKKAGANSILRFGPTIGDENIFKSAKEKDLNVVYGVDLFEYYDYLDSNFVAEKQQELSQLLQKYLPSVSGFVLGNDVIGKLSNYYDEPTLTYQRISYLKLVDKLAQQINSVPVSIHLTIDEKFNFYQSLLLKHCSNIDYVGLNVNYIDDFEKIDYVQIPFYFSSLGVDGATEYNRRNIKPYKDVDGKLMENIAIEENDSIKSQQILEKIDLAEKYSNIYFIDSWTDKMDETFTWYGLTDYKGRLKPSYYAIGKNWNGIDNKKFPKIDIVPMNSYYEEDSSYIFKCKIEKVEGFNIVEWMLCKNNIIPFNNAIILQKDGEVTIKIPDDKDNLSTYRLFLFVSDGENVTTTSYFIPLRWYFK